MPRDECIDCEARYPDGKGLKKGRCPSCTGAFLRRRAEAKEVARKEK